MACFLRAGLPCTQIKSKERLPPWRSHGSRICCSQELGSPVVELLDDVQEQLRKSPDLRPIIRERILEISKELDDDIDVDSNLAPAERIKKGFLKFKSAAYMKKLRMFRKLAGGQNPKFMVIACSDSRVCPTAILGFEPGEAFVVRNIASMVPPYQEGGFPGTSAALEFATLHLKVENILVIGHSRCGGIKALMTQDDGTQWSDFIQHWIQIGKPARDRTLDSAAEQELEHQCTYCEKESVKLSLTNLLTFPWIKDAVEKGTLALHGGYYNFVDCWFEHWTVDAKGNMGEVNRFGA